MATPLSHKRQRQREPTTLMSLGDDMLAEILRRLPSLPSLARAALACPRLRNVASSSSVVKNRFISPALLLGYFVSVAGGDRPSFHRALRLSHRDVAGIVRRGDFNLEDFEDYDWRLMDSRQGLLLLTSDSGMAAFDPVSSTRLRVPHCVNMGNGDGNSSLFHCCFLPSSGDVTSVRVLCLESTWGGKVRPHVYSSRTGEWCSHSLAPKGIKALRRGDPRSNYCLPMHAGGRIYWRTTNAKVLNSLDVGSMKFSDVPLPDNLHNKFSSYAVGDTEDGKTCMVYVSTNSKKFDVQVWFLKEEDGSPWEQWRLDAWEIDKLAYKINMNHKNVVKVYDVTAGVVLLSAGYKNNGIRYLAFCLKDTLWKGTTKTDTKRQSSPILADFCTSSGWVNPYFMAWPPHPSLKGGVGSTVNASTSESEQEAAAGSNKKTKQV
uniref:Uncharacterized protein n=1 Tax=Avena sativa TaxID=4498 RepID=A0ACD5YVH5_AVESA